MKLLEISNLCLEKVSDVNTPKHATRRLLLRDVNLTIQTGEVVALVGESGSGKSIFALSLLGLLPESEVKRMCGEIRFFPDASSVWSLQCEEDFMKVRSHWISMIFQEPTSYLNPLMKIKKQLFEVYRIHKQDVDEKRISDLFLQMGLSDQKRIFECYPHQLSGGMLQRVFFIMSMLLHPRLIIADEPTTALDLINQNKLLTLMRSMCEREKTSLLLITHNIQLASQIAHTLISMVAGMFVEIGEMHLMLANAFHPYTQNLLSATPKFLGKQKKDLKSLAMISSEKLDVSNAHTNIEKGCVFYGRCRHRMAKCQSSIPSWKELTASRARCFLNQN